MVYRIVLIDFPPRRLARGLRLFGLRRPEPRPLQFHFCGWPCQGQKAFTGFPIPAAAGLIASITFFMLWWLGENEHLIGTWKWVLPPLMLFFSIMMFSRLKLSEFQSNYLAHHTFASAICRNHSHHVLHRLELRMDAGGLVSVYLLYGFLRPWVSKRGGAKLKRRSGKKAKTAKPSSCSGGWSLP